MRKPTICICENKDADQLPGNRELISAFVFATWIEKYLCFRPGQNLHSWFSFLLRPSQVAGMPVHLAYRKTVLFHLPPCILLKVLLAEHVSRCFVLSGKNNPGSEPLHQT